ncbi:MAG: hypothetical protein U0T36_07425 [Saprospiraceae bacterium]|jgi:hypothetical protein
MSLKIYVRIAAALILLHLVGHFFGHLGWDTPEDPKMQEVVNAMKGYSGEFMGATRSMADYFQGYSLILFGLFGMSIAILWVISNQINANSTLSKYLLLMIGIGYIYFGIIEYIYFFTFAASISLLAGILILYATFKLNNN